MISYDRFEAGGASEWRMRVGGDVGPPILFVPPLLEEMNRTRALIAAVMRLLAKRGYRCILPDLPGTGESPRALEEIAWNDWRHGVTRAAPAATASVAIRGGCLIDDAADTIRAWRLAPVDGASLVRDLERAGLAAGGGSAGYSPSPALLEALRSAKPSPLPGARIVRLANDRGEAHLKLEGPPLWRRSEPGTSAALASAIAADIDTWIGQCAGS